MQFDRADDAGPVHAGAPAMTALHARLHPWLSVLCDAGCGLLLWVALSSALLPGDGDTPRLLVDLQVRGLLFGALLAGCGLGLFWPPSMAAGPWRLRSLVALALAVAGAVALSLQLRQAPDPTLALVLAALACIGALATVGGLAMLEKAADGLHLPTRLALALLGGAVLLFALIALRWPGPGMTDGPVPSLALLVLVAGALLLARWHRRGGLQQRGRWLVLVLLACVPLLLAALLYLQPGWARVLWPLVAVAVLAGTVVERVQAR